MATAELPPATLDLPPVVAVATLTRSMGGAAGAESGDRGVEGGSNSSIHCAMDVGGVGSGLLAYVVRELTPHSVDCNSGSQRSLVSSGNGSGCVPVALALQT